MRRLTDPTDAFAELKISSRRTQTFTFGFIRHHVTPVPGRAYHPRPRPPGPGRHTALQPSRWRVFFCAQRDRGKRLGGLRWPVLRPARTVICGGPLRLRPAFFSERVTQETAAPDRPWHDLPIESTTGPRSLMALPAIRHSCFHLTPRTSSRLAPRFLPEGLFLCANRRRRKCTSHLG